MSKTIPVVLFAYARPDHLRRTLDGLRADSVPLIYAFSDGPCGGKDEPAVGDVRAILRAVDWCELELVERATNWGLGRSVRAGVTDVLESHDCAIIFEDDLVCMPGTYRYLCAALRHYRNEPRVMSVTGWTHPRVTPADVADQPYFDGRAECWVWGTWARAWHGMDVEAETLFRECSKRGIDPYRYGADLPAMALEEKARNIWAVRWLLLHILRGGLCLRPPFSLVENIGFDALATNPGGEGLWMDTLRGYAPTIPADWPVPVEHVECARLWQAVYGARRSPAGRWVHRSVRVVQRLKRAASRVGAAVFHRGG